MQGCRIHFSGTKDREKLQNILLNWIKWKMLELFPYLFCSICLSVSVIMQLTLYSILNCSTAAVCVICSDNSKYDYQSDILRMIGRVCSVIVMLQSADFCVQIINPSNWGQIWTPAKHWIWLESDSFLLWEHRPRVKPDRETLFYFWEVVTDQV